MLRYTKTTSLILFWAVVHFFLPCLMTLGMAACFEEQKMACCEEQTAAVSMNCCEDMGHGSSDPVQDETAVLKFSKTTLSFELIPQSALSKFGNAFKTLHFIEINHRNTSLFKNNLYLSLGTYLI